MKQKPKGPRQWAQEVLSKFKKLEADQPGSDARQPNWPDWVWNLWSQLVTIPYPGVQLKSVKKWKAKELGRFLGRQYAGEFMLEGKVPLSPKVMQEADTFSSGVGAIAERRNPNIDWKKLVREEEQYRKRWMPKFQQFIQETLASACQRPYHETAAFFEAFGKGIVIKPNEFETERTMGVGDKICFTMIMTWPEIERLRSVAEFHRVLEKALKPRGIIVKYKRIEKLCQRIKLKFKGPGRPPGTKTQTNSQSG